MTTPTEPTRPCPACDIPLYNNETHWNISIPPMGGYLCPQSAPRPTGPTPETGLTWARLNIPNPYSPDTDAWVAFEAGQVAAIEALARASKEERP